MSLSVRFDNVTAVQRHFRTAIRSVQYIPICLNTFNIQHLCHHFMINFSLLDYFPLHCCHYSHYCRHLSRVNFSQYTKIRNIVGSFLLIWIWIVYNTWDYSILELRIRTTIVVRIMIACIYWLVKCDSNSHSHSHNNKNYIILSLPHKGESDWAEQTLRKLFWRMFEIRASQRSSEK